MKTYIVFLILFFVSSSAFGEVIVVGSTPDLAAIARDVGGERAQVSSLSSFREDPHFVDSRPDKILLLNKADLLIEVGLGLESGWLPSLKKQARNTKIMSGGSGNLVASNVVDLMDKVSGDRSSGDIHPGGNPHFTFDPRQGARIAKAIQKQLTKIDPEGAELYKTNANRLINALMTITKRQRARFGALPAKKRNVVSYHRSLPYLMDWLQLRSVIELEPKPGIPPNPKHMAKVLKLMKKDGVRVIIQESFYPQKTSKTIAKIAKAKQVVIDGGARFPKQTYAKRVQKIADQIYEAIR